MLKYIITLFVSINLIVSSLCLTCPEGEYLDDSTPASCRACQSHCKQCDSATHCLACQDRYFFYTTGNTCELETLIKTDNCVDIEEKSVTPPICKTCKTNYWLAQNKSCIKSELGYCETFIENVSTEQCKTVKAGYVLKESGAVLNCSKVHSNCVVCTSESTTGCSQCTSDYFKTKSGNCALKTKNCKDWADLDTEECSSCEAGYDIHPIEKSCYQSQCLNSYCGGKKTRESYPVCNVSCHEQDPQCIDCENSDEHNCLQCSEGYQLLNKECFDPNSVENCLKLNGSETCEQCKEGYTVLNEGADCQANIDNCEEMETTENCKTCTEGHYLIAETKKCGACKQNCTCSEETTGEDGEKCEGCIAKYRKASDSCEKCSDDHCLTCTGGVNLCTVCESGWTVINNACIENIDNCDEMVSATECNTCATGFAKSNANKCLKLENCVTMQNVTHCSSCADEYWADSASGECKKCWADNCKTCQSGGKTCSACKDGYYLDSSKNAVDAICVECTVGNAKYVELDCAGQNQRKEFPWTCVDFTDNCIQNKATYTIGGFEQDCNKCGSGFRLTDEFECESCNDANCNLCDSDKLKCTECKQGYFLKDSGCVACDSTCSQCLTNINDNGTCVDCQDEHTYLLAPGEDKKKCSKCLDNCLRCDTNQTCVQCLDGFYLGDDENKTCAACSTNCTDCDTNKVCFKCKEGSYLDMDQCQPCLDFCSNCYNETVCKKCVDGYELSLSGNKCNKQSFTGTECFTITDCAKCSADDPSKCAQCKQGSVPVNDKCVCYSGKILIGGQCVEQEEEFPEDLSEKTLEELSGLVTAALSSSAKTNTKAYLEQLKNIIVSEGGNTNENANIALQLLLQFSETATDENAEDSYKKILSAACEISNLEQSNFEIAFAAADKFMTKPEDGKAVFDLGFSTCLTNLLKKETIQDIPILKLTNSEFALKKFAVSEGAQTLNLTDISVSINKDFIASIEGEYYATIQAIDKAANPFKNESTNNVTLYSKIVSFSVMQSGVKKTIDLEDKAFPITFDAVQDSAVCGYYDLENKKWLKDGAMNQNKKTCSFSHLTDFAIFSFDGKNETDTTHAFNIQVLGVLLMFIIILF